MCCLFVFFVCLLWLCSFLGCVLGVGVVCCGLWFVCCRLCSCFVRCRVFWVRFVCLLLFAVGSRFCVVWFFAVLPFGSAFLRWRRRSVLRWLRSLRVRCRSWFLGVLVLSCFSGFAKPRKNLTSLYINVKISLRRPT